MGESLFFESAWLLGYAAIIALGFHLFVVLYEEPTLRREMGAAYMQYCGEVPRWIFRLRRAKDSDAI